MIVPEQSRLLETERSLPEAATRRGGRGEKSTWYKPLGARDWHLVDPLNSTISACRIMRVLPSDPREERADEAERNCAKCLAAARATLPFGQEGNPRSHKATEDRA